MLDLADSIDLGLVIIVDGEHVHFCNAWVTRHARISGKANGKRLQEAFGGPVDRHLLRCVSNVLNRGMAYRLAHALHPEPIPLFDPDGDGKERIKQAVDLIPVTLGQQRACLIQIRDVSEAVKRERMLREQAHQLNLEVCKLELSQAALTQRTAESEAANKAKSMFMSVVTHELRSPLHTILGYASLIRNDVADASVLEHLETVERSGLQLMRIIDDILEYSGGEIDVVSLQPRTFSLRDFCHRILAYGHLARITNANSFSLDISSEFPACVEADEQRLMQVVTNLVDNSFKFSNGGAVTVSLRLDTSGGTVDAEGSKMLQLLITVRDNGPGIAEHGLSKIFDPFYRLPESRYHGGLGLGLPIARKIVCSMNGVITAANLPGGGCEMTVSVPLKIASAVSAPELPRERQPVGYAGPRKSILIVDDIDEHRGLLRQFLSRLGFRIFEASSARAAIDLCRDATFVIDLVLTDLFMDEGDGWSLLSALRSGEDWRFCPVIAISASETTRPPIPLEVEFEGVIRKPVDRSTLLEMVGNLLSLRWRYSDDLPSI